MGQPFIVYGKPGSGKTRSLINFGPEDIVYFNVEDKLPPFRQKFKYVCKSKNIEVIKKWLKRMEKIPCKIAVIDDATYIMSSEFMREHSKVKQGASTFDMFNNIADTVWKLFQFVKKELPEDTFVYFIMHEDTNDNGSTKLLTIGKLLDSKVMIEGMVTICLRCLSEDGHHFFKTVTDGTDITKSPEGMFAADEIDNDLKAVDDKIREFYGFKEPEQAEDITEEEKLNAETNNIR